MRLFAQKAVKSCSPSRSAAAHPLYIQRRAAAVHIPPLEHVRRGTVPHAVNIGLSAAAQPRVKALSRALQRQRTYVLRQMLPQSRKRFLAVKFLRRFEGAHLAFRVHARVSSAPRRRSPPALRRRAPARPPLWPVWCLRCCPASASPCTGRRHSTASASVIHFPTPPLLYSMDGKIANPRP